MREILFRGKQADGMWVYGDLLFDIAYPVDPSTIGQFTGLTDKNGKRIFEGDILDCGDRIVYVKWHEKRGQWDSEFIRYVHELSSNGITPVEWKFRAEKIGNIHDNPELLK
jgi:uncharacterized phage protein (TIGR01671 family)